MILQNDSQELATPGVRPIPPRPIEDGPAPQASGNGTARVHGNGTVPEARPQCRPLSARRLAAAKRSFCVRRVPRSVPRLWTGPLDPRPGDVLLARVEQLGQHKRLQLPSGRRSQLYPGDEILVTYGHRYAPNQFEAEVPASLAPCHLVASGGIASALLSSHSRMKRPTRIVPIGILADDCNRRLNLADFSLSPAIGPVERRPLTIAVVGTAMDSGKTTTASHLVRGLTLAGLSVGAAKVTGTGAGGDVWALSDAGARRVYDFTDAGHPSTYRLGTTELERIFTTLTRHLARKGLDAIVLEVADGLVQDETSSLLNSPVFARGVDSIVFAACDAMGAGAGVEWLTRRGLPVTAVSGAVTASELGAREARGTTGLPVLGLAELVDPVAISQVVPRIG